MTNATLRPPLTPIQPGAYSAIDASALRATNGPDTPTLAILGAAAGGIPNTPLYFSDGAAIKSVLRSGVGYDAARFAFGVGANPLCFMRVGNGILQSTKVLAGTTGTGLTLTSLDYGVWNNQIMVTTEANNKLTIAYTDSFGVRFAEVYDLGVAATYAQQAAAINGLTPGWPKSTLVSAVAGAGTLPLAVAAESAMISGSDGALVAGDWTTGLTALESEDVSIVVPASGDAAIHALVQTHCTNMSTSLARKERTAVFGAVAGETPAAQVTRMTSLRQKRSQLVYPGMQDFNDAGLLTSYDPFYTAAVVGAIHVTQPDVAEPATHKPVPIVDVERKLSTLQGSDVDVLLRAGVTPIAAATGGGFWIVDSLSGYNTDDVFRDYHKGRTADYVVRRVRSRLEEVFVGHKILDSTANAIASETNAELQKLRDETILRAFQSATVQPSATDARTQVVSLPVVLPETQKYILLTLALQPSSAIAAGAQVADDALL